MKNILDPTLILRTVDKKKKRLEAIKVSDYPFDLKLEERHEQRVREASHYLEELQEVSALLDSTPYALLVGLSTYLKLERTQDSFYVIADGEFVKIGLIYDKPFAPKKYIIWLAPIEAI